MEEFATLEQRIGKLEFVFGQGAEDTVRVIQEEMLKDLYQLREALKADLSDNNIKPTMDVEPLLAEIKRLQEENGKLNYQIGHLKRHIDN